MSNSIKDSAQAFAVNQVLKYVDSNPQEAFPKLLDWADKFDKDNLYLTQRQHIRKVMEQPDSNWMRLINSLWTDIDSEVRKVFFRNFIVNASLLGSRKQVANREKYGCNIPWAILMDPTSACNLHCTGCWAAEYGNKLNLSYEELDDIINQRTNVVYLTAYRDYSFDAWDTGAIGFMVKPLTADGVKKQLKKLRYPFLTGGEEV